MEATAEQKMDAVKKVLKVTNKKERVILKSQLANQLKVGKRTFDLWVQAVRRNSKHVFLPNKGRPLKTSTPSELTATIANQNQLQRSTRLNQNMDSFLVEDAKKTARARSKPSHGVSISTSTVNRRKRALKKLNVNDVKAQPKTEVRVESEDSAKNLATHFATGVSTTRDVHPALIFNTDKTTMIYNCHQDKYVY
jgi:hypothetical protein